ncbi:MAG: LysR substrate-binding domain-containing protein [Sulfobacillus sp.]
MNLEDLEVFRTIAFEGTLSKAALCLNLSQPTVSRRIQGLEHELGVTLLDRSTNPVHVTPHGIMVLEFAQSVLDSWRDLKTVLSDIPAVKGTVTVAASTVPAKRLVLPAMAHFLREYPEVQVRVSVMDSARVLGALNTGNVDVGFVGFEPSGEQWHVESIAGDEIVLVVPDTPRYAHLHSPVEFSALQHLPFVQRESGSGTWNTVRGYLLSHGIAPNFRVVCEVDSNEAIIQTVATGVGVGFASQQIVAIEGSPVRVLTLEGGSIMRNLHVVTKWAMDLSDAANIFIRYIKDSAQSRNSLGP